MVHLLLCRYFLHLITIYALFHCATCATKTPNIAVVGGGIGGTATAYFLQELFGTVSIDLYESDQIGGRLATVTINNEEYESGGSIIHPKNKYMLDFLNLAGLKKRTSVFSKFGLYDGTEFVFTESDWQFLTLGKLIWRYGYGPIKLQRYISDLMTKFDRIYTLQNRHQCFTTVRGLLKSVHPTFAEDLTVTTRRGFIREGFSEKFVDEMVTATLTANYGQTATVHKFVGIVSVAGADGALWAVEGGNKVIPKKLLELSKSQLINAKVSKVTFQADTNDYLLEFKDKNSLNSETKNATYDIVVMATPLTPDVSNVEFDLPSNLSFPGNYHRTICTIVRGTVDFTFFGFANETEMIDEILTVNLDNFYNSFGRINAVTVSKDKCKGSKVWKIFSREPIEDHHLNMLFTEIKDVEVVDWLAYPHYTSSVRDDRFVLHTNLYHVNAIEWAASAMEMSAIGARNVALLAYKRWEGLEYRSASERFIDEF